MAKHTCSCNSCREKQISDLVAHRWDLSKHGTIVAVRLDKYEARVLWDDGMVTVEDVDDLFREGTYRSAPAH